MALLTRGSPTSLPLASPACASRLAGSRAVCKQATLRQRHGHAPLLPPLAAQPDREKNDYELPLNLAAPSARDEGEDEASERASSGAATTTSSSSTSTSSASSAVVPSSSVPYPLVAALAGAGAIETAYLTWVKLTGTSVACPLSGCESVLTSSYSELFGVPLSLLGMLTYAAVAAVAVAASQQPSSSDTRTLDTALATGTSLLGGTSGFLIFLLQTEFSGQPCAWCYLSAALSFSSLVAVMSGLPMRRLQQVAAPSLGGLATAVLALYFNTASVGSSTAASSFELPYSPPQVTTSSSTEALTLSQRLKEAGAKMYGAFWCSHCLDQKQEFGKEAMASFPYVECFPDGWKRGVKEADACEDAGVRAFPTWVINGQKVAGELTFDEIDKLLRGEPLPE